MGNRVWLVVQGSLLFAITALGAPLLLSIALYAAGVAYAVAIPTFGPLSTRISLGAIVLGATGTALASNVYRGATLALVVGGIGLLLRTVRTVLVPAAGPPQTESDPSIPAPTHARASGGTLTMRELEVIRLAAGGVPSREIAGQLDVTERTVKAHLAAAYRKLGARSRAEAVAIAARLGLIT